MGLTSKNFYIFGLLIFLIFGIGAMSTYTDIANNRDLNQESVNYVNNFAGSNSLDQMKTYSQTDKATTQENQIITSSEDENNLEIGDSNTNQVYLYNNKLSGNWNFFTYVYQFPTFILMSFGLNIGYFSTYLNSLMIVIYFALFVLFINYMRGLN